MAGGSFELIMEMSMVYSFIVLYVLARVLVEFSVVTRLVKSDVIITYDYGIKFCQAGGINISRRTTPFN